MIDYRSFTLEDFLQDESFRNWVFELNDSDKSKWELWLIQNSDKREIAENACALLLSFNTINELHGISEMEKKTEIDSLMMRINQTKSSKVFHIGQSWYKVAATIALFASLGIATYFLNNTSSGENSLSTVTIGIKNNNITHVNHTQHPLLVTLADGSSIVLQANSSISYLEQSATNKREVNLSGEAFFEIAKDKNRPFYIYSNGITTKVTGTSFTIRAFKNEKEVKVIVKTGKVNVYESNAPDCKDTLHSVALLPDQQAIFKEKDHNIKVSSIVKIALTEFPIQQAAFDFEQTPITDVFKDLENAYRIKIVSGDTSLNCKKITAYLNDRPYSNKLDLICKLIDAQYEQHDNVVIIKSNPL